MGEYIKFIFFFEFFRLLTLIMISSKKVRLIYLILSSVTLPLYRIIFLSNSIYFIEFSIFLKGGIGLGLLTLLIIFFYFKKNKDAFLIIFFSKISLILYICSIYNYFNNRSFLFLLIG